MASKQQTRGGEDVEKREPSALLVGMQTGVATVERSMELSQEIKNGPSQRGSVGWASFRKAKCLLCDSGQGTCLGCRPGPQLGHVREGTSCVSHTLMFSSVSWSLPSLLSKVNTFFFNVKKKWNCLMTQRFHFWEFI